MIPNDELFALATEAGLEIRGAAQVAALRSVAILIYRMVAKETAEDCAKVCEQLAKQTKVYSAEIAFEDAGSAIRKKYKAQQ